jgi:peptidoglycan hydrolase-like protein with peptidoglycan-binding domain
LIAATPIDLHQCAVEITGLYFQPDNSLSPRLQRRITVNPILKHIRLGAIAFVAAAMFVGASPIFEVSAQTAPATTSAAPTESVIKALQEALNKQGIAVKVDGVLDEETRVAIRKYQSQHHVPVTGEPDKATLDKLGVRQSATPTQPSVVGQAGPTPPAPAQASTPPAQMPGGMMNCPMMQGQMQSMMQMMQGMMQTMQMMQAQMQSSQSQPGQMQRGPTGSEPPKPN